MDWRLSERERNPAKGPALDAGSKEAQAGLSGADWMRRGLLAERLKRRDDAEWAYRVCVNLGFNFTAWAALARIYSEMGLVSETLVAAAQLMSAHNSVQEWKEYRQIPPSVGRALGGLVARVGLRAVQEAADKMDDVDEAVRVRPRHLCVCVCVSVPRRLESVGWGGLSRWGEGRAVCFFELQRWPRNTETRISGD